MKQGIVQKQHQKIGPFYVYGPKGWEFESSRPR